MPNVRITVPEDSDIRWSFEVEDDEFGIYRDAIFYPASEWAATTEASRIADVLERVEAWKQNIRESVVSVLEPSEDN